MKPFEQEQLQELLTYYKSIRETGGQELLIALLREIQSLRGCLRGRRHENRARRRSGACKAPARAERRALCAPYRCLYRSALCGQGRRGRAQGV